MENSPLSSEPRFKSFLASLCCTTCKFFIEKKCTEVNAVENERNKVDLAKAYASEYYRGWKITPPPVSKAREDMLNDFKIRANDINNYFVCVKHEYNEIPFVLETANYILNNK